MFRGETISTTITNLPIPVSEIKSLYIVFKDGDDIVLEKTMADCVLFEESIEFKLSQEESLGLHAGKIERSVLIISVDGSRFESYSSPFICKETVKDEVLV